MTGTIISSGLVVSAVSNDINADSPIVGYQNLITAGNVAATTQASDFPASNLANVITHLLWKAAAVGQQYVTVVLNSEEQVDYLAVAAHNFGTGIMVVSVEGNSGDGVSSPQDDWFTLVDEQLLATDGPIIFKFTPQALHAIRLKIQSSRAATPLVAQAGVMYVGKLLYLQRRVYVGHTPMPMGRRLLVSNLVSVSGAFMGRIVNGQTRMTTVDLQNLTPDWYRAYMEPFLLAAQESPFFFGWRPATYPTEAGFGWLTGDPIPANQRTNGMMQVSFDMAGIA